MTIQPQLFDNCLAIRARQGDLFAGRPVVAWGVRCDCGADLIETDSYLICPRCRGKLIPDPERGSGRCFEDEGEDER